MAQIPAVKNHKGLKALVLGAVIVELGCETPVDRPKPAASWRCWAPPKKEMNPQKEEINLQEEKVNPQEEKMNLQEEKLTLGPGLPHVLKLQDFGQTGHKKFANYY